MEIEQVMIRMADLDPEYSELNIFKFDENCYIQLDDLTIRKIKKFFNFYGDLTISKYRFTHSVDIDRSRLDVNEIIDKFELEQKTFNEQGMLGIIKQIHDSGILSES